MTTFHTVIIATKEKKFPFICTIVFWFPETSGSQCPNFQRTVISYLILLVLRVVSTKNEEK